MRYLFRSLCVLTALYFIPANVSAGEICKRVCIYGFEAFCARAHTYQANVTRAVDHVVLYIEKGPDGALSIASNVKSIGVEYPTKIVGFTELKDLDTVFINLDGSFKQQAEVDSSILERFHETVKIYVTPDVLNADGSSDFDFRGVAKIHVLDPSGTVDAENLGGDPPPPVWVSKIAGCCFKGRPPSAARELADRLEKVELQERDTRVLSLVVDSAAEDVLKSSRQVSKRLLRTDPVEMTDEKLEGILEASRGSTLIVLGHVQDEHYVVEAADGTRAYSVQIQKLRTKARERNVQLIDLGCRTGRVFDEHLASVGIAEKFLAADAAKRIEAAFSHSKNLKEFLTNLSDEKFSVIADKDAFDVDTTVTAGIYTRAPEGSDVRVGELGVTNYARSWVKSTVAWLRESLGLGQRE